MDISVIIPVYNGEKALPKLYKKIKESLSHNFSFEILFVYDCGKDNSWTLISELMKNDSDKVKGYRLDKNRGQHYAIFFGISKSSGNFIVTMDDDLQHDPSDIIRLMDKLQENDSDIVYGSYTEPNHSFIRKISSIIVRKLLSDSIPGLYKNYSPFRLMKRGLALKILNNRTPTYDFIDANIKKFSDNISEVTIKHNKSLNPKSNYTWINLINHLFLIMITYSKLIKIVFLTSFLAILISFGFHILVRHLTDNKLNELIYSFGIAGGIFLFIGLIFLIIKKKAEVNFKEI